MEAQYMSDPQYYSAALVYTRKGYFRVLLVHFSGKKKTLWSLPLVAVGPDEDKANAIGKELKDVFGLDVAVLNYLGKVTYTGKKKIIDCFVAELGPMDGKSIEPTRFEIDGIQLFELPLAKKLVDRQQQRLIQAFQAMQNLLGEAS